MDQCKNCRQGYTKEGYAAYPDHIELCPLHALTFDLLEAAKAGLSLLEKWDGGKAKNNPTANILRAVIAKAESPAPK